MWLRNFPMPSSTSAPSYHTTFHHEGRGCNAGSEGDDARRDGDDARREGDDARRVVASCP